MSLYHKNGAARSAGAVFGIEFIAVSALLAAMSMGLKLLSFTAGPFRIGFENLPVLMAGILFGPVTGGFVGACADIVGCVIYGYAINPIITVGAAAVGFVSGFVSKYAFHRSFDAKRLPKVAACVFSAHFIGSVIIKSIGLYVYFKYPVPLLLMRIPQSLILGSIEAYVIYMLLKNKAFTNQIERMCRI